VCIQTDPSGAPLAGNALKGEATIGSVLPLPGVLSEYNAIAIQGNSGGLTGGNLLTLDAAGVCAGGPNVNLACSANTAATDCPGSTCTLTGAYNPCPSALIANHSGEGTSDSFTQGIISNELTLVPCTELFEQQTATHAAGSFEIVSDMEVKGSAPIFFDCMLNERLGDISTSFAPAVGSEFLKTRMIPSSSSECYTGDYRCHICTGVNDLDPQCLCPTPLSLGYADPRCGLNASFLAAGTLVGGPPQLLLPGCNCSSDADCPNAGTAGRSCTLSAPASCSVDGDCALVTGCGGGVCICSAGSCVVSPPISCVTTGDCSTGQSCTGTGVTLGCRPYPGLLGVIEEFQSPATGTTPVPGTAAVNLHVEGSRPGDLIVLPAVQ
jgi:hypothetical protein